VSDVPPITGAAEIVLSVRDIVGMREFYREVLGFPLLSESRFETGAEPHEGGVPTIVFLTITDTDTPLGRHGHPQLLALIDYERHVFARERFDGHDVRRSTLNHLAFEIPPESYDAHRERLDSLGLDPREASFPAMQARALFFKDPEGNTLELICHHVVTQR
jgi:catechol 2,3-dioxygenase-like lactoylglutathione lyase family enzyme